MSDVNTKAQQALKKARKTGKTVTKTVAPGLVYKVKVTKQ